jgi:hypothetical protein
MEFNSSKVFPPDVFANTRDITFSNWLILRKEFHDGMIKQIELIFHYNYLALPLLLITRGLELDICILFFLRLEVLKTCIVNFMLNHLLA